MVSHRRERGDCGEGLTLRNRPVRPEFPRVAGADFVSVPAFSVFSALSAVKTSCVTPRDRGC